MVTFTNLTTGANNTNQTSVTTATITPSANKLILISVGTQIDTGVPSVTSITGCGLTFTQITNNTTSDGRQRNSLWRATASSTTSGTLTISLSSTSARTQWIVTEVDGVDISGTNASNAIVQSATTVDNSPPTNGTLTVTLNAFAKQSNVAFGTIRINLATTTLTSGSGFTQIAEIKNGDHLQQEYKLSEDTSVDWTYANPSGRMIGIAVELKALDDGGSFLYNFI